MMSDKYKVVKTDEGDWAIVYDRDGVTTPIAMSILSEDVAWEMARHLNNRKARSVIFRSNFPDANLVITGGKGFHIRFANGRGASVQWGTGNYCDRQNNLRGRDFFEVQVKDEKLRKVYTEFEGTTFVNYEQMFADWGSNNAEISPGPSGTEEGWMDPDKIVETLYNLSKMPALEGGKEPSVDEVMEMIPGTTDCDLLNGISVWKETESGKRPHIHEWRNYLPEKIMEIWERLTPRERALCFILCYEQAGNEEWD
jgi:hypothetical protein